MKKEGSAVVAIILILQQFLSDGSESCDHMETRLDIITFFLVKMQCAVLGIFHPGDHTKRAVVKTAQIVL